MRESQICEEGTHKFIWEYLQLEEGYWKEMWKYNILLKSNLQICKNKKYLCILD